MERLKIVLASLVVLALLSVAWRSAARSLMSHEDRIRSRLEEMVEGFQGGVVRRVLSNFHEEYRDEGTGYDRDDVREALQGLFFNFGADRARYTLEIPEAELVIAVAESEDEARVTLRAVFHRERRGERKPWWDARAVLHWTRDDGRWEILRTSEVNHRERSR